MIKGILAATILSSLMAGPVIAAVTGPVSTNSDALYPADQLILKVVQNRHDTQVKMTF